MRVSSRFAESHWHAGLSTYEGSANEGDVKGSILVLTQALYPGKPRKRGDPGEDRVRGHCNFVISGRPLHL